MRDTAHNHAKPRTRLALTIAGMDHDKPLFAGLMLHEPIAHRLDLLHALIVLAVLVRLVDPVGPVRHRACSILFWPILPALLGKPAPEGDRKAAPCGQNAKRPDPFGTGPRRNSYLCPCYGIRKSVIAGNSKRIMTRTISDVTNHITAL